MVIYSINQSTSCRIFFRFGKYQIRAAVSEIIWAFRFIIKWPIIILYISNSFELKSLVPRVMPIGGQWRNLQMHGTSQDFPIITLAARFWNFCNLVFRIIPYNYPIKGYSNQNRVEQLHYIAFLTWAERQKVLFFWLELLQCQFLSIFGQYGFPMAIVHPCLRQDKKGYWFYQ